MSFFDDYQTVLQGAPMREARDTSDRYAERAPSVDRTRKIAGRQGADLFQQNSKQNMAGIANPANRANHGAILGQAHSVMGASSGAQGASDRTGRLSTVAKAGLGLLAGGQQAGTAAAGSTIEREHMKKDGAIDKFGAGVDALAAAVSAYGMASGYNKSLSTSQAGRLKLLRNPGLKRKLGARPEQTMPWQAFQGGELVNANEIRRNPATLFQEKMNASYDPYRSYPVMGE